QCEALACCTARLLDHRPDRLPVDEMRHHPARLVVTERIFPCCPGHLGAAADMDSDWLAEMAIELLLQPGSNDRFREPAPEQQVSAVEEGADLVKAAMFAHRRKFFLEQPGGARDIDRPQQGDKGRHQNISVRKFSRL